MWDWLLAQGLLDALIARGSEALVDRQCLPQGCVGLAGAAVVEVAVADSFQGPCLLQGCAEIPGEGQGLGVVFAGLGGWPRSGSAVRPGC